MMEQVDENHAPAPKVYECSHCDRSFNSSQALAGHCKSHYYRKDLRLPPHQRNIVPPPPPAPTPAQQQQQQVAVWQPTMYHLNGQYYNNQNPHVLAMTDQLPQATYGHEPVTYLTRVTPRRGGLNIVNYEHGLSSNGGGAGGEPGEGNNKEELDLTLRLGRNW